MRRNDLWSTTALVLVIIAFMGMVVVYMTQRHGLERDCIAQRGNWDSARDECTFNGGRL